MGQAMKKMDAKFDEMLEVKCKVRRSNKCFRRFMTSNID